MSDVVGLAGGGGPFHKEVLRVSGVGAEGCEEDHAFGGVVPLHRLVEVLHIDLQKISCTLQRVHRGSCVRVHVGSRFLLVSCRVVVLIGAVGIGSASHLVGCSFSSVGEVGDGEGDFFVSILFFMVCIRDDRTFLSVVCVSS